ncbi:F-box protein At2g17036-like [Cornus florida]|uniref:F-box protein At2g17036-like n=1 Tax=Cornus florida TaxID=4283 RepID=UPI0028A14C5A|nr:F-box protein At2g17036-like [Cornus florida]
MGSLWESESDWAWLPMNLFDMILYKLVSLADYVRFGAVCKSWQSVAMDNKVQFFENKGCRQVPFLMVPSQDDSHQERRSLYNIINNKLFDFQVRVPYKKRLSGSSHGWLFTVEESFGLTLINPFSGATIELPPIINRSEYEYQEIINMGYTKPPDVEFKVMKAILSADPVSSPGDYIISAIYSDCKSLAFIQPGDRAWTYIDKDRLRFSLILDVIFYKGQILAVDGFNRIIMVDLNRRVRESKAPQVQVIAPPTNLQSERNYLVESSSGDLLLVHRNIDYDLPDLQHTTFDFKVFKVLLQKTDKKVWAKRVEVNNLGGDTMFLGDNHSICVSASKWPGCQPNSIYYTDDYIDIKLHPLHGRRDLGIFNVENGNFGMHYSLDPSHKHMPPSIWIVPSI